MFAGSDRGGVRAAAMYTLIGTARLADVLDRIAETPQTRLDELLPRTGTPAGNATSPLSPQSSSLARRRPTSAR